MSAAARRIAMWSGPRNISTAMMRSWGNRDDTVVCDEPLYAHYLQATGLSHPGAAEVIASHEADWKKVVHWLTAPLPPGRTVFYQKHMAHHLLDHIDRRWLDELTHCFLIRDPREMLTSLLEFLPEPRLEDTGLPQQLRLFRDVAARGEAPPVLDARDVLTDPERCLRALCQQLGLPFQDGMLRWPPGSRETDGVWGKYWYARVNTTESFAPYQPKPDQVPQRLTAVWEEAQAIYEELGRYRLN